MNVPERVIRDDLQAAGGPPRVLVRGLSVRVETQALLNAVDITVARAERVALLGHNGAGKSTLLRALSGFQPPADGRVTVLGEDLHVRPSRAALRALRARVAQVLQGQHLVDRLIALDNVLIGAAARCRSRWTWLRRFPAHEVAAARAALARVGMDWAAARRTDSLSGGERQKVAIARALNQRAEILLADEPTASLDAAAAREIAAMLGQLAAQEGATLICVLHDLELVPLLADRVLGLRDGSLVLDCEVARATSRVLEDLIR